MWNKKNTGQSDKGIRAQQEKGYNENKLVKRKTEK